MAQITINGRTYVGGSVSISKNKIIIDGKEYVDENTKVININITGDVDSIMKVYVF